MGFNSYDLTGKRIICQHPGANSRATYFIDGTAYCFRSLQQQGKDDQYCAHPAGYGTAHLGEGACKYHYALQAEGLMIRYGKYLKKDLAKVYAEFAADEQQMLDLTPELVLLRTLLANSLGVFQDTRSIKALETAAKLLTNIGDTVDRIDRIQSRQILTAAMAKMIFAKALQTATQFIDSEKLPAFVKVWQSDVVALMATNSVEQADIIDITPKEN